MGNNVVKRGLPSHEKVRQDVVQVLRAAITAVDPFRATLAALRREGDALQIGSKAYELAGIERVIVVGAGKAGAPMAAAVQRVLGNRITAGSINVKYGHNSGPGDWRVHYGSGGEAGTTGDAADTGRIEVVEAGHPVPDEAGLHGAGRIAELLAGLTERDLVIVLISGGGSALLPLPVEGISLENYQKLTDLLLASGADITQVNIVRKHCSRLQGGQLARLAAPAQVAALILSDVVGTPLDAIASGPAVPDRSTFGDAWNVLEAHGILDKAPVAVREHLRRGIAVEIPDTPKPGDSLFERVETVVIGDNAIAARAAAATAVELGYNSTFLGSMLQGEAREVGRAAAGLALGIALGQSDFTPPACLVLGGETTVTITGKGLGGRNQELALSAALSLAGHALPAYREIAIASLGTDGTDGPTDAAGAIAMTDTPERAKAAGLDARAALRNNDSYHFFAALGDLLITGPTQTNVNDLILVVVR